jgi:monoamine oxidase
MSRTRVFDRFRRALAAAEFCDRNGLATVEGLERLRAAGEHERARRLDRRGFLRTAAGAAAAAGAASLLPTRRAAAARKGGTPLTVGVVGAGLAGLACADALEAGGAAVSLFEAAGRTGGRVWSMGGAFPGPVDFPGQVVERGGELIDTTHRTMRGWVTEFGLATESMHSARETAYWAAGALRSEAEVVDEFRALVPALQADLRTLSNGPTADSFTPGDVVLDNTNLREYLETRGAGPILRDVLDSAYTGEYGCELERQSALNLLFFVHADRRSKFKPFGVFSDERFHVVGGNEQIPRRLAARLQAPVHLGHWLVAARREADGRVALTFDGPGGTVTQRFDAVVLTVPFSILRDVHLDESLGLPAWKRHAIDHYQYGTNAKTMVGFDGRPWQDLGYSGASFAYRPDVQNTWETNPSRADAGRAVLTDYAGGDRGAALSPNRVQRQVATWLRGLEDLFPGAQAAATRLRGGAYRAHLEPWPSSPYQRGSYTCNAPGYFTSICGNEARPVGNVYFAGEHTDPFYEWQGFMEGAANSGLAAAAAILAAAKKGA